MEGKKKYRGKVQTAAAAAALPKLDPRKRKILREHPLHVILKIQTKVKAAFSIVNLSMCCGITDRICA